MTKKEARSAYHKDQRERWEKKGLCKRCGGRRNDKKFKLCETCRDKTREWAAARNPPSGGPLGRPRISGREVVEAAKLRGADHAFLRKHHIDELYEELFS